jgi:hypothetical protein
LFLVDFGVCLAYKSAKPNRANQRRQIEMAKKKPLKKAKKLQATKPLISWRPK